MAEAKGANTEQRSRTIERLEARAGEHVCGGFFAALDDLQRTELFTTLIFDRLQRKMRTVEALRREAARRSEGAMELVRERVALYARIANH